MACSDPATQPTLNGLKGPGRPSKRSKKVVAELMDAISAGAPFNVACQAAGIHPDTFQIWRRRDPDFALEIDQAAARGAVKRLKKIAAHGEENWASLAWMLERRWPLEFSKPEVALSVGVGIQNNVNGANGQSNLELVVIKDLEYAGLRQREGYTHHADESVRDVEAQVVPEEVSGHLTRDGAEDKGQIVSASQAAELNRQAEEVHNKVQSLMEKYRPQTSGNGAHVSSDEPVVPQQIPQSAEPAIITHRDGDERSQAFWHALVSSDPQTPVARETATFAIRALLLELQGLRAHRVEIEFRDDPVRLEEMFGMLEKLSGPSGWKFLQKKAGF